jgi:hypothetical protein
MLIGMQTIKAMLMKFQMEMRIPLGIGLKVIHVTPWQRI